MVTRQKSRHTKRGHSLHFCHKLLLKLKIKPILATQEAKIRRIKVRNQPGQIVVRSYLKNIHHKKKGLLKWLEQWSACLTSVRP
jgi:hypothetical protein